MIMSENPRQLSLKSYIPTNVPKKGWNRAPKWNVYFCGYFDSEPTWKTFLGDGNNAGSGLSQYSDAPNVTSTARLGAVFTFKAKTVKSRVGVSFISADQACRNVNQQIPDGSSLGTVKQETRDAWNSQVFSKVTTTDTDTTNLQLLYSSLYHMHLIPTNKTGENPLWTSSEPYYDDIFTLWDLVCSTARCLLVFGADWHSFAARRHSFTYSSLYTMRSTSGHS
jgi:putative alpha-1,2-mannosidase